MDPLTQKLIASFIFGGALIGLQSYAAEKVPKQIAGLVLSLPSTIIVNFVFLGLILSPAEFHQILAVVPAPLGFSLFFITAYIYIAKWLYTFFCCKPQNLLEAIKQKFIKPKLSKSKKIILITVTALLSSVIWLALSLPLAIYKFDNLLISLIVFLVFAVLNHWIINRGCSKYQIKKPIAYKAAQQIARACFAGLMVAITVYLGATMGALWGGVMAMFPAAFLASICIIHYYYDHEALFGFFKTTPVGISTLVVYAFVADWSFAQFGVFIGTLISITASLLYSLALTKFTKA